MDLRQITDLQQLKAMAYDEMQRLEIAKQNVQLINQRIAEIEQSQTEEAAASDKKKR